MSAYYSYDRKGHMKFENSHDPYKYKVQNALYMQQAAKSHGKSSLSSWPNSC